MNTQLLILSSGTIFASSGVIDLYDNVPVSLNFNIADIKEPQKRNADYSKTIKAPGTNNNNNLLSHIYEIGIDRLYNPNKKVEARVLHDGIQVFKGYIRLAKIIKLRDDKIEYEFELRGRLDDLFTNVTDLRLTDLSWSDLNHIYSETNIANSWTAPVGSNYVYPFIDYGYEPNINNIAVDHIFPAVYIKEAWDRIFRSAGFQYSSTFLTSTFFKSLIMPFTGESMRLTSAQIQSREFSAERATTNQTHIPFNTSGTYNYFHNVFNDDSTSPRVDIGNCYNTTTGIYTVPATGYYNFVANLSVDGLATPHGANQYLNYYIYGFSALVVNGVAKSYGSPFAITFPTTQVSIATASTNNPAITNNYVTYSGLFNAGDTVFIQFEALLNANADPALSGKPIGNVDYQIRLDTGSYFYAQVDPVIKAGDVVEFANTLPADMKIVDFLVSIIKMFNLYFEYDKDIPNKIYIEPRNDYYNSTVQDWSDKLDASQEPEIIPMGALNAKRYQFTYKQDGDVLNDIYHKTHGEVYGEKRKDIDNDFLKNTEKMELIFSPSPQYGVVGTGKFYPALYNVDASMKVVHNKSMNPRILYYGGLKSCSTWYLYTVSNTSITYGTARTTYPYCGMMDDPSAPTVSLDFEAPFEVFYTPSWGATYSNNNLYNKHWKQFIEEITDYNSSIVTAWFWLKPADILEVDFRHIYRFLNQNFRLNKIYDYNPTEASLTKCEFIKVKNGIPFVPDNTPVINGSANTPGIGTNSARTPAPPSSGNQGTNSMPALGNINQISGSFNNVSPTATGVFIQGNANSVGTGANNISIINSSGCIVAGGLVNVSIVNSSGITVTTSNTSVTNNIVSYPGVWQTVGNDIYSKNSADVINRRFATFAAWYNERANGTEAAPTIVASGNNVGDYAFRGYDGAGAYIRTAMIRSTVAGTPAAGRVGGTLRFFTSTDTSPSVLTEQLQITQDGRVFGFNLHNNSGAVTGTTNQYIASGTYTPTLTGITNVTGTTAKVCQWIRVGNVVTVSGGFNINATAAGGVVFEMTLPISITGIFSGVNQLGGTGAGGTIVIKIQAGNDTATGTIGIAQNIYTAIGAGDVPYQFSFTYLIL